MPITTSLSVRVDRLGVYSLLTALLLIATGCGEDAAGAGDVGDERPDVEGAMMPRFDPGATDFFRTPWPNDYRRDAEGFLVLDDFPNSTGGILGDYVDELQTIRGFSTMPVVFVVLDDGPGVESFPRPADTLLPDAPIQLMDVSPDGCGDRVPLEVRFEAEGDDFRDSNTLAAAPVGGFQLLPNRPYAFIVHRDFGLPNNLETTRPAQFEGILEGSHENADLVAVYAPLAQCLQSDPLSPDDVAVATVFTTQDPLDELRRLRAVVVDPQQTASPTLADFRFDEDNTRESRYRTYTGTYQTPMFQAGDPPYGSRGGAFVFGDDGTPQVQRMEAVPFVITHPTNSDPPYDVLIWSDGTGAELDHHITGEPVRGALNAGFAVATFQPQFHGDRSGNANPELHTFNFANPEAFRTNFRQQVIDTAYFVRVVREALDGHPLLPALETDTLVYGGHSQGAIVGAIAAGVETEFTAYVLNGIGGYLSITAVERDDPIDFNEQIRAFLGIPGVLDRFHPVIALIQTGGDASDPINYARLWRGFEGHEQGSSLYLINGQLDHTTPEGSINAITVASAATRIEGRGWDTDPFGLLTDDTQALPITGNTTALDGSPLTIATFLSASNGHYTIYDLQESRELAIGFWQSALTGAPVLE